MAVLRLIGKKGSKSARDIRQGAGILVYKGNKKKTVDGIINYGLAKPQLQAFFKNFPSAANLPIINRHIGYSKYNVCCKASRRGIVIPETKLSLSRTDKKADWIEKKINSIAGRGIIRARGKKSISGKYYQKFIKDRVYELRVHSFKWLPQESWRVQKRVGDKNEIAWNFHAGGHFITISQPQSYKTFANAVEISDRILDMLGMSFGAVDFLVDSGYNVYFIEINSAPGFGDLSRPIYVDAFNALKNMKPKEVSKYAN